MTGPLTQQTICIVLWGLRTRGNGQCRYGAECFNKTLDGSSKGRRWFESFPSNSIDEWWKLREAFTTRYSIRKACYKEPHEITKIVRKANETLTTFKERWTVETGFIYGVQEMSIVRAEGAYALADYTRESRDIHLRLSFPVGHETSPTTELFQRPRKETEMVETAREKISERATIEILTRPETTSIQEDTELQSSIPPKGASKQNRTGTFIRVITQMKCIYKKATGNRFRIGKAESLDERPEAEGGKETKQKPSSAEEAEIEGYLVRRVYVDEGSSVEVMFEHCFENLPAKVKAGLRETRTDLVGFAGEVAKPLGKINLEVCFGNKGLSRRTSMKFIVIRAPSPYNVILGRPGMKMVREETPQEEEGADATDQIIVNPSFPDQMVTIGGRLSKDCKDQLKTLLKGSMEVFLLGITCRHDGVPRKIIEHALNTPADGGGLPTDDETDHVTSIVDITFPKESYYAVLAYLRKRLSSTLDRRNGRHVDGERGDEYFRVRWSYEVDKTELDLYRMGQPARRLRSRSSVIGPVEVEYGLCPPV
ncbi:hypothetical protein Tco_0740504 [Tanacetum coccineum]